MKFRKKPAVIEAVQIPHPGGRDTELEAWLKAGGGSYQIGPDGVVLIHTLEGIMAGQPGDWIIRGVQGEFYPCRGDIFTQTYEDVKRATPKSRRLAGDALMDMAQQLHNMQIIPTDYGFTIRWGDGRSAEGETLDDAYINALHQQAGTQPPPF
jgi:hypothetical protein